MKPGITISCIGHVGILLWGVIAFSVKPMSTPPAEALPVDFITTQQFSELTAGVKNAPKLDTPKPVADKVDVPQPIKQAAPKVEDKPEIVTDAAAKKPPTPDPKPKPPEKTEKKKEPDPKLDQIAEELKKEDAKKPKTEEQPPPKKPAPKFDANQVAALLDKRDPRRKLAAAEALNNSQSLGTAAGSAAKLSQSEIDALRARINECWNPPAAAASPDQDKLYIVLRVQFRPDGSIARDPSVIEGTASTLGPVLAESAKRALLGCQPFTMLKPEHFDQWKDIEIKFDPHDKIGG
jgi:colicin import membrane protein